MSIDVRNLSFAYGKRQVLRQVSFRTSPGQLVAVLGPNGAGKSTLFRCILGFLPRYRGEAELFLTITSENIISPKYAFECANHPRGLKCQPHERPLYRPRFYLIL